jgi:predicted dithiol-disulfide oxidoreductase (DUF899 family)
MSTESRGLMPMLHDVRFPNESEEYRAARDLSSAGSSYRADYGAESEDGDQWPLATVFVRRGDKIYHFWSSELFMAGSDEGQHPRHVDFMWPMWAIFDTTPEGRGDFHPSLSYS